MSDLGLIPEITLARIKKLLKKELRYESACLIHKDWGQLTPITNVSGDREQLITPTGPEYDEFVELLFADKLFGWAHSHPRWAPWPSNVDLKFHQFPIHMLIYSISEDQFGLFSPSDLTAIEQGAMRPPSRYTKFKNPVTQGLQLPCQKHPMTRKPPGWRPWP